LSERKRSFSAASKKLDVQTPAAPEVGRAGTGIAGMGVILGWTAEPGHCRCAGCIDSLTGILKEMRKFM